jgi:hypothetical protein
MKKLNWLLSALKRFDILSVWKKVPSFLDHKDPLLLLLIVLQFTFFPWFLEEMCIKSKYLVHWLYLPFILSVSQKFTP